MDSRFAKPKEMSVIYSSDPAENAAARDRLRKEAVEKLSVFPGAMILVSMPNQPKMIPGLVEYVIPPSEDFAQHENGDMAAFGGKHPRITAMIVSKRSDATLDKQRMKRDAGLPHDLNPIEYVRLVKLPHYEDVERQVLLADGALGNILNCPYYLIVEKFECR